ncbi:hypothetical protein A3J90_07955 [candidate division WOR-1 bacterium RIFOXYC2_FULL_37_10]|uniref:HEPN domain-containing protein n=1 Tax=candidate division WOR-1 bacterium RIFOXYB2_FULL_37_13 TaxID=1802579 RepID=A0A1F4SPN7_UNCSA|nr:MAG: hypothetical protein A2246_00430 [candidate division WOR-1 bacterium RIFOXYA2_FULL_37_7]OGC22379.1 MAG: hypothetical protein A2310_01810 [candidate division WOR-1 bacterium RIFOXYB2_FULL_37_13]OGC35217.1 MAG: hypothetical protein A3J90_07955 [candidate division WOR-1 bacterium RIFOXYC2_FULL_37_10]
MNNFEDKYFIKFQFSPEQAEAHFKNALKDFDIAKKDKIIDVKFNYSYTALIKAGIALLSHNEIKVKSLPGHHIKIIDKMAQILKDEAISDIGNAMRSKRNIGLYSGGIEITEKESREYLDFVEKVLFSIKGIIETK